MKSLISFFAVILVSATSFAQAGDLEIRGTVTGTVKFEQKSTKACTAVGCPPKKTYTQVTLVRAKVDGYGPIREVVVAGRNGKHFPAQARTVTIAGVQLRPGLRVEIEGTTKVTELSVLNLVLAETSKIKSIKILR
ncbi:MAG: hypothetical protein ACK5Y2_06470 [Bdellovibrionales bacterium]